MRFLARFKKKAQKPDQKEIDRLGEQLVIYAEQGNLAVVEKILADGANVNARLPGSNSTALNVAAANNFPAVVARLMREKPDLALSDKLQQTALHGALRNNASNDITLSIITAGAPLDARDMHGATPAFYASQNGNTEALQFLIAAGADICIPNKKGVTPLMWATGLGHNGAANLLLEKKPALDAQDEDGRTALMHAAVSRRRGLAEKMIAKGAQLHLKDKNGDTAEVLARRIGAENMTDLFETAAAQHVAPFVKGTDRSITAMKRIVLAPAGGVTS